MSDEIDLIVVPGEEWRELLAAAAVLDLVHGGYYRARSSAIQFYCSPENRPEGWAGGFPEGSPETPRAGMGTAEVLDYEEGKDQFTIRLAVSNWGAARDVKRAYQRGEYGDRYQDFVLDQESALRGTAEERRWLRAQFERLRRHAAGELLGGD